MRSKNQFVEVRRGYDSPFAFVAPIALLGIAAFALIQCYISDAVNGWFVSGFVVLITLALLSCLSTLAYRRTVAFSSNGYSEKSQLFEWVLWREHYSVDDLEPFEIESTYSDLGRVEGRQIVLCLTNGERRYGMAYPGNVEVRQIMNRLNRLLEQYKSSSR